MEDDLMPFKFGQFAVDMEFTNRVNERKHLVMNFRSGQNCVLISPRRWGKSSLVHQACKDAEKEDRKLRTCMIDLFNVQSEEEFYKMLAESVIKATSTKMEERIATVSKFIKQLVPVVSFSPLPSDSFELSMNWKEVIKNPSEILNLAEQIAVDKNLKLVVCVDEFQNIAQFENPLKFQQKLRSHWQKHQHVAYCIYGSKRNMMLEVFTSAKMPFYKFGDVMFLDKIHQSDWEKFIVKRFKDTGKKIDKKTAARIAQYAENHPYYVQQLAQLTWLRTSNAAENQIVDAALEGLIDQLDLLFQNITSSLTKHQLNFLHAILDGVQKFNAKENLKKYDYGTSGNVKRIKEALLAKEIIDIPTPSEVNILDPIYKHWLRRIWFAKR